MAKKLVSRTAKVLSETKKNKDNIATAIAYEHIPRNKEELNHGSIYAVIELEDNSGRAEEIAERIISVLNDSYYKNLDIEPLESFEASLAKINEELTERSSEGQINWLGKLNAVLAIFSDNTLHVTQTGKAEAYLYRGEHTMHITEDLAGDSINPQRTFKNIASGALTEKDKVALVTPGVFYKISKSELKEFTTNHSPNIASENISKMLSGESGTIKPNAVLLMEIVSPESFVTDDTVMDPDESWVEEKKDNIEEISTGVASRTVGMIEGIGTLFTTASLFLKSKAYPFFQNQFLGLKSKIIDLKTPPKDNIIIESEESLGQTLKKDDKNKLNSEKINDIELTEQENEEIQAENKEIRIKEKKKSIKILPLERFDFSFIEKIKKLTSIIPQNINLKKIKRPKGKNPIIIASTIAFLAIGLIFYFGYFQNIREERKEAEGQINNARSLYEESIKEIENGNFRVASSNLQSAKDLAEGVKNKNLFTEEANALLLNINERKDEASRITKNTARPIYEFKNGAKVSKVLTNGTLLYAVDFTNGNIFSIDPRSGSMATISNNPEIDGKVRSAVLIPQRNVIALYTDQNEVHETNLLNGRTQIQPISGGVKEGTEIDHFGTSIYFLSPINGQIFRHLRTARGYGQELAYFTKRQSLENTVGVAIDGSIYITDSNANVRRFTRGVEDQFSISENPIDYSSIRGIYTRPNINFFYLFTENLIIKFSKDGKFIAQYKNDEAKNINSVTVVGESTYFISDNRVFLLE